MRRLLLAVSLLTIFITGTGTGPAALAQDPAPCGTAFPDYRRDPVATGVTLLEDQAITMSDGVVLYADVYLPAGLPGPFPTSLTITGYGKQGPVGAFLGGSGGPLTKYGYASMTVDDRGTGASGGRWDSWGDRTRADYAEVLDWIVAQPWSDGRVGLTGPSYMGITSLFGAATGHPAVKAVFAIVPMADAYRDIVFAGGQVNVAFIPLWMGLVTGLSLFPGADPSTVLDHILATTSFQVPTIADSIVGGGSTEDGEFWRQRSPIEVVDRIQAPTFVIGGLDDLFQRGEPMLYEALARRVDARLLIGPWAHIDGSMGGGLPTGGVPSFDSLLLQWFDHHVRGLSTGSECVPPVTQYVRGEGAERYVSSPTWPVPGLAASRWHLRGSGALTAVAPASAEAPRTYLQLPINGLCSRSTNQWLIGLLTSTPCGSDNRLDEATALTWTSEPFAEPMTINGPIQADLWLQTMLGSDAVTSVAISDVAPDGTSRGLSNGLLLASDRAVDPTRARMLDGQSIQPWHPFTAAAASPVTPGQPTLVPVEVFPTSAVIAAGHRLRITVAAYDVPHALPSLPQGLSTLAGPVQVLSDPAHPSSVVLPVVAASSGAPPAMPPAAPPAVPEAVPAGSGGGSLPTTGASVPLVLATGLVVLAVLARRLPMAGSAGQGPAK